jgi:hypothetical protein
LCSRSFSVTRRPPEIKTSNALRRDGSVFRNHRKFGLEKSLCPCRLDRLRGAEGNDKGRKVSHVTVRWGNTDFFIVVLRPETLSTLLRSPKSSASTEPVETPVFSSTRSTCMPLLLTCLTDAAQALVTEETGGPFRAVLWDNGEIIDLDAFIPSSSDLHLVGDDIYINDEGEIVVSAILPNGDTHAVLLIPCGEASGDNGDDCQEAHANPVSNRSSQVLGKGSRQGRLAPEELEAIHALPSRRGFGAGPRK